MATCEFKLPRLNNYGNAKQGVSSFTVAEAIPSPWPPDQATPSTPLLPWRQIQPSQGQEHQYQSWHDGNHARTAHTPL